MTQTSSGLQFVWFTGKNRGCFYASSTDNGNHFSPRNAVSEGGSHPQILAMDKEVLLTWDETVQAGSKVYKKIGMERRTADGQSANKTFITSDTSMASFPVLARLNTNTSLVAYSKKMGGKDYVAYQIVGMQ